MTESSSGRDEFAADRPDPDVEEEVVGSSNPGPDDHSDLADDALLVGSSNPGPDDHSDLADDTLVVGSSNPGPDDLSEQPVETAGGPDPQGSSDPGPDDHHG